MCWKVVEEETTPVNSFLVGVDLVLEIGAVGMRFERWD